MLQDKLKEFEQLRHEIDGNTIGGINGFLTNDGINWNNIKDFISSLYKEAQVDAIEKAFDNVYEYFINDTKDGQPHLPENAYKLKQLMDDYLEHIKK